MNEWMSPLVGYKFLNWFTSLVLNTLAESRYSIKESSLEGAPGRPAVGAKTSLPSTIWAPKHAGRGDAQLAKALRIGVTGQQTGSAWMCGVTSETGSTKGRFPGSQRPSPCSSLSLAPPPCDWHASPPMRYEHSWGWLWWDGTDGGRQGKPHVLLHLLHLIDFPQKEKNK